METDKNHDREAWLGEACGLILDEIILPIAGCPTPPYRVSMGHAHARATKVAACCYRREVSTDGTNEIFVNPGIDDSAQVLSALTHELIHACDDCQSGHRNFFARVARAVGLEGPLTSTHAGDALRAHLQTITDLLGPIPHARLDLAKRPKQTTRMIKIECSVCDLLLRGTMRHVERIAGAECPACHTGTLLTGG